MTRLFFTIGMKMVPVLLGWYLYHLTGSKLALGILGLSEVVPAILFALPAGVKVDTSAKRILIIKCIAAYILILAFLAGTTSDFIPETVISANTKQNLIFLLVGLTGWIRAYISPSFTAIIAQLVPADTLVKAASVNSMTWLIAAIIGPAFAGFMIGFFSISVSFMVALVFLMTSMLVFLNIKEKEVSYTPGRIRTWQSVLEGLRFVYHQKALLGAMGLDMFAVLFGGVIALLPVFAKDILNIGPQLFGLLMAATYLGNFLAILWLTRFPLNGRQGYTLIYAVGGFGICIILFGVSTSFWLSFAVLFVGGLFDGISVIIRGTIFQLLVPDHMRGRASSVNSIFVNSSNELGQFESGVAASLLGTVPSVIFGGGMTLLIAFLAWLKIPALKKLEY